MTEDYINSHWEDIRAHGSVIEQRLDDSDLSKEELIADNLRNLELCRKHGCEYILSDGNYEVNIP